MAEHVCCLELIEVRWKAGSGESRQDFSNLLEIWPLGGLIHTSEAIAIGTSITILIPDSEVEAKVQHFEQDEFGFYIQFRVQRPWFPSVFQPTYVLPELPVPELRAG